MSATLNTAYFLYGDSPDGMFIHEIIFIPKTDAGVTLLRQLRDGDTSYQMKTALVHILFSFEIQGDPDSKCDAINALGTVSADRLFPGLDPHSEKGYFGEAMMNDDVEEDIPCINVRVPMDL